MATASSIVICCHCSNPFRVTAQGELTGTGQVACPYCAANNHLEMAGVLTADPIDRQSERAHFWDAAKRQEAKNGHS